MENMINKILEMDKKSREMEAAATENKEKLHSEIERRKRELYDQYSESLKEIIDMTETEQQELLTRGKKNLDEKTNAILQAMEQAYQNNGADWIAHITKEIVQNAE